MHGLLVVDKPAGLTSHDVVDRARRLFRTRRIGHTGTLDPDATGVLVLCLGRATRLAEFLATASKHYTTELIFGARTDTMDASGIVVEEASADCLTEPLLRALLPSFRGLIRQTPPMVSARHHEGRRLYELAREGVTVPREAREIHIDELDVTAFRAGRRAHATLEITCSTGTYIRVLADDLGTAAGCGAFMQCLRRTWVGADADTAFTLADAHTLEELDARAADGTLAGALAPVSDGLRALPHYSLQPDGLRRLRHGQTISADEIAAVGGGAKHEALAAVLDEHGEVCAMVRRDNDTLRPIKVLAPL